MSCHPSQYLIRTNFTSGLVRRSSSVGPPLFLLIDIETKIWLHNQTTMGEETAPQDSGEESKAAKPSETDQSEAASTAKKPRRVIRRKKRPSSDEVPALDPVLLQKVLTESGLPKAYSFELEKSVQRVMRTKASHVALQMPEGLLLYATVLADALKRLAAPVLQDVSILGDVTYGACCVGDLDAQALGAQLLIHYGHSCLVPLQHTVIPVLYVFVEIQCDIHHLVDSLDATVKKEGFDAQDLHIYALGTVQFRHALVTAKDMLMEKKNYKQVSIPQCKPLSPGEVLGCTSPKLHQHTTSKAIVCFLADGRFHLEST